MPWVTRFHLGFFDELGQRALDLARVLPELPRSLTADREPGRIDPEQDRWRLFRVVGEVLGQAASQAPALLIVEDVHWADDGSLDLLHSFARTLARQRVLLLVTYRSDEVDRALRQWLESLARERLVGVLSLRSARTLRRRRNAAGYASSRPLAAPRFPGAC